MTEWLNSAISIAIALLPIAVSIATAVWSVVTWRAMRDSRRIQEIRDREEARKISAEADHAELGAAAQVVVAAEESVEAAARITEISQQQLKLVLQQVTMLREQLVIEQNTRTAAEVRFKEMLSARDKEINALRSLVHDREKKIKELEKRIEQLERNGNGNHH